MGKCKDAEFYVGQNRRSPSACRRMPCARRRSCDEQSGGSVALHPDRSRPGSRPRARTISQDPSWSPIVCDASAFVYRLRITARAAATTRSRSPAPLRRAHPPLVRLAEASNARPTPTSNSVPGSRISASASAPRITCAAAVGWTASHSTYSAGFAQADPPDVAGSRGVGEPVRAAIDRDVDEQAQRVEEVDVRPKQCGDARRQHRVEGRTEGIDDGKIRDEEVGRAEGRERQH